MSVGFWFSLGHSSVVFVMVMGVALGVRALSSGIGDENSALQQLSGIWGTAVSGLFLLTIGLINLAALIGILHVFREMRQGRYDEAELDRQLDNRGFLNRVLGKVTRAVSKPWHMYPTGFLFGLGFDTVTEIGLLVIAGGAVAASLPWWAVITLPILFAAGMSLLDTLDGAFMTVAYGWAFSRPVRKIYYNITVTALSVAVALIIGGIEIVGLLADKAGITGGPLAAVANLDLEHVATGSSSSSSSPGRSPSRSGSSAASTSAGTPTFVEPGPPPGRAQLDVSGQPILMVSPDGMVRPGSASGAISSRIPSPSSSAAAGQVSRAPAGPSSPPQ